MLVSLTGTDAGDFSVSTQPETTVAPGSAAAFTVQFNPSAPGVRNASINLANDDADEAPYSFSITGNGVEPDINVEANGVTVTHGSATPSAANNPDFGLQPLSSGMLSRILTIQNTGNNVLTLGTDAVTLTGPNADDFTVTTQPSTTAAVGDSTAFTVQFAPSAAGARNASINIANDNVDEAPFNFEITGTGMAPPTDSVVINETILPIVELFQRLPENAQFSDFRKAIERNIDRVISVDNTDLIQLDALLQDLWDALRTHDGGHADDVLAQFENLLTELTLSDLEPDHNTGGDMSAAPTTPQAFAIPFSKQRLVAGTFDRERRALLEALNLAYK